MPLYEYRCEVCGARTEAFRPMAERNYDYVDACEDPELSEEHKAGRGCPYTRVLSPTSTTFRFNDFKGYDGLSKSRSMWKKDG